MNYDTWFKRSSILITSVWLILFGLIPYSFIFINSLLKFDTTHKAHVSLSSYHLLYNPIYLKIFLRSIHLATVCTLFCLMIAYPFAYFLAHLKSRYKHLLLVLVIIPFWTSSLIRTYAIIAILKAKGVLNMTLLTLGIISQPLQLLHTNIAVIIGLIYDLLPFMIMPLYANFEKLETAYVDAARDLGASRIRIFLRILIPLTLPGILSGSLLVFLPAMSLFYIPELLGGAKSLFLGNLIQRQFLINNWPLGATLSLVLITFLGLLLLLGQHVQKKRDFYQNIF